MEQNKKISTKTTMQQSETCEWETGDESEEEEYNGE